MGDSISTCGDSISTMERWHQYYGGIASVLQRLFSAVGDSISTVEAIQYCGGIASVHVRIASVLWRLFSTVEGYHQYMCG